jgi:hypothetical protein
MAGCKTGPAPATPAGEALRPDGTVEDHHVLINKGRMRAEHPRHINRPHVLRPHVIGDAINGQHMHLLPHACLKIDAILPD